MTPYGQIRNSVYRISHFGCSSLGKFVYKRFRMKICEPLTSSDFLRLQKTEEENFFTGFSIPWNLFTRENRSVYSVGRKYRAKSETSPCKFSTPSPKKVKLNAEQKLGRKYRAPAALSNNWNSKRSPTVVDDVCSKFTRNTRTSSTRPENVHVLYMREHAQVVCT